MLFSPSRPRPAAESEAGYVLLAVIFLTVVLLISLAVAAPKIALSIQRQKEIETVHRGEQYKRALQLYYRKFGAYPTSIDQLVNTNNIRFLRKRYTDPLTGKDDWKLVRFGQAHVRPLGFFGQPLGTGGMAGGLAGAAIISGSMYAAAPATNPDGTPATTDAADSSSTANSGGFGNTAQSGSGSGFGGSTAGSSFGSSGSGFGTSGSGFGTSTGTGMGSATATGTSTGTNSPFSSSTSGNSGTTFGGGGFIVGVTLPVDKPSLLDYKKQTRYNKWEFNYDPMEDQMQSVAGAGGAAGNVNNTSSGTTGMGMQNSGTGGSFGSSSGIGGGSTGSSGSTGGFGSTGSTGSSGDSGTGAQPPTSTPPQ